MKLVVVFAFVLLACQTIKPAVKKQVKPDPINNFQETKTIKKAYIPVNTRGVALDTDGDGIPDYRDKEVLTFSRCFPVDSLGVGVCPEPDCCKVEWHNVEYFGCYIPTRNIHFKPSSAILDQQALRVLDTLGNELKANPDCNLLMGTLSIKTKKGVALAWERVNGIISYLVNRCSIDESRFSFMYDAGEIDVVELRGSDDDIPIPQHPPPQNVKTSHQ